MLRQKDDYFGITSALITPAKTSPIPPEAIPALPELLITTRLPSATKLPAPLSKKTPSTCH